MRWLPWVALAVLLAGLFVALGMAVLSAWGPPPVDDDEEGDDGDDADLYAPLIAEEYGP